MSNSDPEPSVADSRAYRDRIESGEISSIEREQFGHLELRTASNVTFRQVHFESLSLGRSIFRSRRFGSLRFEDCNIDHFRVSHVKLSEVAMVATRVKEFRVDDSSLTSVFMDHVGVRNMVVSRSTLSGITSSSMDVARIFFSLSKVESSVLGGKIATWVGDRARFLDVDLSHLELRNAALGVDSEFANVRFPSASRSFVVPSSAFEVVRSELRRALDADAMNTFQSIASQRQAPFESIDDSSFQFTPEELDHPLSPEEQGAILNALFERRVEVS